MKAAFKQASNVELQDIASLPMNPGHIRVRVEACGICGADLLGLGEAKDGLRPFGHEISGTVEEIAADVTFIRKGARIVLDSATPCGRCDACHNEQQELCSDIQSFFMIPSFGMAESMLAPAVSAIARGDLPADVACLAEPLGVAIDLVRLADISADSNVLVVGPGPIGLMALALARHMGARRVFCAGFEEEAARCAVARQFGADDVVDPRRSPLEEHDFGCTIDRVLSTAPPNTLETAFKVAGKGGIISFIGLGHGAEASLTFDANDFHFKKLQLRASFASPALYTPRAVRYLHEGVVDGEALISHRFRLDEIEQAMATARDRTRSVKVIVLP